MPPACGDNVEDETSPADGTRRSYLTAQCLSIPPLKSRYRPLGTDLTSPAHARTQRLATDHTGIDTLQVVNSLAVVCDFIWVDGNSPLPGVVKNLIDAPRLRALVLHRVPPSNALVACRVGLGQVYNSSADVRILNLSFATRKAADFRP